MNAMMKKVLYVGFGFLVAQAAYATNFGGDNDYNTNTNVNTNANTNNNANINANANLNLNKNANSNRNTNNNRSNSRSNASASNFNANSSFATGGVGYGGHATAGASATGGNSSAVASNGPQTTTVTVTDSGRNDVRYSGGYDLRTVGVAPDMITSPTAPCRVALGAGGGPMGWALSIAGSVLDEGCDAREDSRHLHNIGKLDASVRRLCAKPEMAAALGEIDCPKSEKKGSSAVASSGFVH